MTQLEKFENEGPSRKEILKYVSKGTANVLI